MGVSQTPGLSGSAVVFSIKGLPRSTVMSASPFSLVLCFIASKQLAAVFRASRPRQ